nr:acyl-CoA thioesterase domain-containing protein [Fodinicola feengrottensis]
MPYRTYVTDLFYEELGGGKFRPTEATTSPWDQRMQHGGPPTALLATEICRQAGGPPLRLARITVDFLAPIPRSDAEVAVHIVRPGRRTQLTEATMVVDGKAAVVARAWQIAVGAAIEPTPSDSPPAPTRSAAAELLSGDRPVGLWRGDRVAFCQWWLGCAGSQPGVGARTAAAVGGLRSGTGRPPEAPLVGRLGERPERADVPGRLAFHPTHAHGDGFPLSTERLDLPRLPHPHLSADGGGMSEARLYDDEHGYLGSATQPLYVGPRG